jgi:small-conductance mechanosensitive channel
MTTIQDINRAIIAGSFTNDQLVSIGDAIRFARAQLTQEKKRSFRIGDLVKFNSAKRGMTVTGTVNKIAIKYITVTSPQGLWRVPANMLEAA